MLHPIKSISSALLLSCISFGLFSQNAVKDTDPKNDIMFQTFGWDEQNQPKITGAGGFYNFYVNQAQYLNDAGIDMMWFPPPSQSTGGVGYIPTRLFNFSVTSWGTEDELDDLLETYNDLDMYPVADVVVNHRGPENGWAGFVEPEWDCTAITADDDGGETAQNASCTLGANDTGEDFSGVRDLDHTNSEVQEGVKDYLDLLTTKGFKGWRWDLAKGFSASYFGQYNDHSDPYYSVGEYWDGNRNNLVTWIDGTGGNSGAFDFANYYSLSNAIKFNSFGQLNSGGKMPGLSGLMGYDDKAVTFVDNHDTFVHDDAFTGDEIMKAYAYILTHPGIPCVSAMHYYGGTYTKEDVTRSYDDHQEEINILMGVRKQAGIYAWSAIDIQESGSSYAAYISKEYGGDAVVAVRIGSTGWEPSGNGWIENLSGTGYKVWSKKNITTPEEPEEPTVNISMIGAGISNWSTDVAMTSTDNENYTLSDYSFSGGEVKFRQNAAWTVNWGGTAFPSGTGELGSEDNIPVPAGSYDVTFNRTTGAYTFTLTGEACTCTDDYSPVCANGTTYSNACEADCAEETSYTTGACATSGDFDDIGIIGTAVSSDVETQWDVDVDMTTTDGYFYTLTYTFLDGVAKFRQDDAWTINWGAEDFPSGTGVQGGGDIPVTAGTYDVTFNRLTGDFTFSGGSGIHEAAGLGKVLAFPNPASSAWTIRSEETIVSIELLDYAGRTIFSQSVNGTTTELDASELNTGIYIVRIQGTEGVGSMILSKE